MTPQEKELLESLATRIANTAVPQKDAQAEALIRERIGSRPDALYILTQTVLIQEMALNQANSRLHELEQQLQGAQQQQQPTSFLGRLFGSGPAQRQAPPPQYNQPGGDYQQTQYANPGYGGPAYQAGGGGGSSFLRSAAATATGVAAGALAFEGIEALLGHHGGFGGYNSGFGGGQFLADAPSETIINNYYDEPRGDNDRGDRFENAGYDDSDRNDDSSSFLDDASDSSDYSDDSSSDDSSVDV